MRTNLPSIFAFAALTIPLATANAQGFGVFEHGTCAMARAGTGVANTCDDGSAIFFNPAGLTQLDGIVISVGVTGIQALGGFVDDATSTRTELDNDIVPVPHLYIAVPLSEQLAAGLGVFVPYGLGTRWPAAFEGRFNGYDNDLRTIYIQPTVAYQASEQISFGAGFDIGISSVELNQRADLSAVAIPGGGGATFAAIGIPFHTDFADVSLKATNAIGFGANFGVMVQVTPALSIGARYLMKMDVDYEGDVVFTQINTGILLPAGNPLGLPAGTPLDAVLAANFAAGAPLAAQTAMTSLPMPDQLVVGLAFEATPQLNILADYQLVRWSTFESIELDFASATDKTLHENYVDTHGIRLGFEYEASDALTVRAGVLHHTAAAPDETVTPLLPEGVRDEFTAGLGFNLSENLSANVAYQYILQQDRAGRVREPAGTALPTVALNSGIYDFKAHLFALTLTLGI